MFREAHKTYLVPGIEEVFIPTSEPEDKIPVHVIPDEGERVRPEKMYEQSLELTYYK